eukprot:gene24775-31614_t
MGQSGAEQKKGKQHETQPREEGGKKGQDKIQQEGKNKGQGGSGDKNGQGSGKAKGQGGRGKGGAGTVAPRAPFTEPDKAGGERRDLTAMTYDELLSRDARLRKDFGAASRKEQQRFRSDYAEDPAKVIGRLKKQGYLGQEESTPDEEELGELARKLKEVADQHIGELRERAALLEQLESGHDPYDD